MTIIIEQELPQKLVLHSLTYLGKKGIKFLAQVEKMWKVNILLLFQLILPDIYSFNLAISGEILKTESRIDVLINNAGMENGRRCRRFY